MSFTETLKAVLATALLAGSAAVLTVMAQKSSPSPIGVLPLRQARAGLCLRTDHETSTRESISTPYPRRGELTVWYRDIRLSAQPHNRTDLRLEVALTPEDAPAAAGRDMAEVKHVLVTRQYPVDVFRDRTRATVKDRVHGRDRIPLRLHKSMTTSRIGCAQHTRRLPSAGSSSGSGP
jgi:hypothetical protein